MKSVKCAAKSFKSKILVNSHDESSQPAGLGRFDYFGADRGPGQSVFSAEEEKQRDKI
jgi:hypothetical protein